MEKSSDEAGVDIKQVKQAKPIVRAALITVAIGIIAWFLFVCGAYYSCGKSEGYLTWDLYCLDRNSLKHCYDQCDSQIYEINPEYQEQIRLALALNISEVEAG